MAQIEHPPSKTGPFSTKVGFVTEKSTQNEVETILKIEDHHLNAKDIVHGGVIATMVDNIIGDTLATTLNCTVVTINININYLSAAKRGDELIAKGRVIQQGYRIATGEGEITDKEGNPIAKGTGTFKVIRPKA
ncbi:PaaI family thioesterase [Desertibacillus haloalkaliphilus]|uniref:PaaI family thioesterase n=1 Tax=Desertibacillus haloalkaliphilus TaxID=1328930 RepID=UPI001C258BD0|nr:PaaI family thioesterase [Desertibacillus haloalkaliphilus]MBU8906084.1 PaaI family thioesterase [Desertibacillus haloalkaliphilus]